MQELARVGFNVEVVTNAEEVEGGFRTVSNGPLVDQQPSSLGKEVVVHTTAPLKRGSYIPWSNPFVSKLLGLTLQAANRQNSDVIIGWYFEPYGLVAALAGLILGKPVVLRHAGSDLGRLSLHNDLRLTYSWMLQSAACILTSRGLEGRLYELGAARQNVRSIGPARLPTIFRTSAKGLDVDLYANKFSEWALQAGLLPELVESVQQTNCKPFTKTKPVICCYGKVGQAKGSFSLLSALAQLAHDGCEYTFLSVASGHVSDLEAFYRLCLTSIGLRSCTWILPPLPPWEIPSLLATSNMGLFLENRFPISFHAPKVPREILASGVCLICASEIIQKHPYRQSFVDMENVVMIEDPTNVPALATRLRGLLDAPTLTRMIGKHGRYLSEFIESELPERNPLHSFLESYLTGIDYREVT